MVQGGSLLIRNNFTREGFRVNILPRGKELRKERIHTPEYGVDFDDDNLVLVCRVKYGEKVSNNRSIKLSNPAQSSEESASSKKPCGVLWGDEITV